MSRRGVSVHASHRVVSVRRSATGPVVGALVAVLLASAGCGGGSPSAPTPTPTPTPSPPTVSPPVVPCSVFGGIVSGPSGIVNGTACTAATSSVVLVNLRTADGLSAGQCSGTVIASRAVLTAAHCLDGETASVKIYLGTGDQLVAKSFHAYPGYQDNTLSVPDVGVVLTSQDLGRGPIPVLFSRDARAGEDAIIAGWGQDQNGAGTTLRAGPTTVGTVGATFLETQYTGTGSNICSGDSGGPLLLSEGGAWAIGGVTSAASGLCTSGTSYFTSVRDPGVTSFILGLVPDAARR